MNENFILDMPLGKLAKKLRILGFNTIYYNNITYDELEKIVSKNGDYIVLTKSTKFYESLYNKYNILFIKSDNWKSQLRFLVKKLKLKIDISKMFSRCIICNSKLIQVEKEIYREFIPDYVYLTINNFKYCKHCKKVYWRGTHVEHMIKDLFKILK
ncbi:Mut7-C RNAse domain-containing protein [Marinitoga sp. 1155]|uniref:Mut7-C RNAse domain-containing protein n=1 Tax=Marinitoga sp. 1155 TaxID=1428448 RepID=UPI00064151FA|nr:Mut7-C RNAse domain-containing protein [Marinitoga sp. 1155]KLO22256.1 hypothetical protein X274_08710 [Marinitoga sp. 1155]